MAAIRKQNGVGMIPEPVPLPLSSKGIVTEQAIALLFSQLLTVSRKLNGQLSLGDGSHGSQAGNLDFEWREFVTPGTANTEFEILHGLQRKPICFFPVLKDRAVDLYADRFGSWTSERILLKATVIDAIVKILLF